MITLTPYQKGAIGDGVADDAMAIMAMFSEAAASGAPVRVDMTGRFAVSHPISVTVPSWSTVIPGILRYIGDTPQETLLILECGESVSMPGIWYLDLCQAGWAHRVNRLVNYGVNPHRFVGGSSLGFVVRGARRGAILPQMVDGVEPNCISANLGYIRGQYCGSSGHPGHQPYTKLTFPISGIQLAGSVAPAEQRSLLTIPAEAAAELRAMDHIRIGSEIFEVTGILGGQVEVYPWPSSVAIISGGGEAIIGAGLETRGGNTAGLRYDRIFTQYTGAGGIFRSSEIEGGNIDAEASGLGLVLGGYDSTVQAAAIGIVHAEGTVYRYVTTYGRTQRCSVRAFAATDLVVGVDAYVIRNRKNDGSQVQPVSLGLVTPW